MKKTLSLISLVSAVFLTSQASAKDGLYAGVDLVLSKAQYKYVNEGVTDPDPESEPQGRIDGNGVGVGASIGYKKSFNQVFVAPEVFYDYLNSSTKDYYHAKIPYQQDTLELRSRYGAKVNIGHDFTEKFSSYLTAGVASVDQITNSPSLNDSRGKTRNSAIYGLGAIFKLNDSWAIRAEFNTQRFNATYYDANVVSKIRLNVLKTGLVYSF